MLWACYASLLRDTLGESPRLTFAQARDRMRDYLVAAYKMTPADPTLLEARDALLAADPADYRLFGAAFAKRGAGTNAVAPPRGENTNTPVTTATAFSFSLVVSDGLASSAPSSVSITVTPVNRAPVASAGADQSVSERATVTLDGSASSDPDGGPLVYAWTAPRGIRLVGASTVRPSLVAPSVRNATSFALSLVVTDAGGLHSAPDTVLVRVRPSRR